MILWNPPLAIVEIQWPEFEQLAGGGKTHSIRPLTVLSAFLALLVAVIGAIVVLVAYHALFRRHAY
jgi:hypothetical protein